MYDTMSRMGGFLPQLDIAVRIDIETCARRLQFAHTRRPFFDEHLHRFRIAEGGTSRQRVPPLKLRRITGTKRRSNAALCVRRRGFEQRALRDHCHVAKLDARHAV